MMVLFDVQMSCRQRAAVAAMAPPMRWLNTPCALLVRCRSWAPWGLAKTEGKIKGPARACPQSQSARGVAAARRLLACVPSRSANQGGIGVGGVPSWMRFAASRWSLCHDRP